MCVCVRESDSAREYEEGKEWYFWVGEAVACFYRHLLMVGIP